MTKKKIWEILEEIPQEPGISVEKLLDSLAQRIFLPEMDNYGLTDYYVSRTEPIAERFGYPLKEDPGSEDISVESLLIRKLGIFEKLLWNKLVHPPQNVLLLVGGVGCGKTMTAHLIDEITENIPKHCERPRVGQDGQSSCRGKRLHIMMDFNEIDYMHETDYNSARKKFVKDLSDRMSANLYNKIKPTDTMEFIDFWNYEIRRQGSERNIEFAFSEIAFEMHLRVGPNWENIVDDTAINIRKKVLRGIRKNEKLFLDYLCRFWRYILGEVYEGKRQCVFAILDNIDCATPVLQAAVRDVVISHQKRFGNTFVVCLRPETLLASPEGAAANIVDIEPHCGPEPFDVIVDRLKKFLDDPEKFLRPGELSEELEEYAQWLAGKIYEYLTTGRIGRITREFIGNLAGSNIRNALIMATNLMKLKIEEEHDFRLHELNRALISLPQSHYERSPYSTVENIFHVDGSPDGRLLIKARILLFMSIGEYGKKDISQIITAMANFGYGPDIVCKALNEMMEPAHQLIFSSGKTRYSETDFVSSETDKILLTYAGTGYAKKLMYDLDYIEMVMLDCVIESSSFPILSGHPLLKRFRAVIAFMEELNKVDYVEMLTLDEISGKDFYISNFGNNMLTWEIIRRVSTSIWRILLSLERENPEYSRNADLRTQLLEVYKDIINIMNLAAHRNQEILLRTVRYANLKPLSEKLRNELDLIED